MSRIYSSIFGTAEQDCAIKTRETFSFLPRKNNSVTNGLLFLLLSISRIMSSKTVNILRHSFGLYSSMLL